MYNVLMLKTGMTWEVFKHWKTLKDLVRTSLHVRTVTVNTVSDSLVCEANFHLSRSDVADIQGIMNTI